MLTITGIATLYRGLPGCWHNYWGGFVFASFGIIAGILMIVAAFKRPARGKRIKDRSGFLILSLRSCSTSPLHW